MRDLRSPAPKHDQTCPVCGAQLAAGALYCEACGTDLSRSGALFSTGIKPVSSLRRRRRIGPKAVRAIKVATGVAGGAALLVALGSVPAVGARVPVLGTLGHTVQRFFGVGPGAAAPAGPIEEGSLLVVRSNPPGAQVYLDDMYVGSTPMSRAGVLPGTHRIRISREGYQPVLRAVEVGDGPIALDVTLRWTIDMGDGETTYPSTQTPAPPQQTVRPPAPTVRPPVERRIPLTAGTAAPAFVLKDRFGVLHKLDSFRGRKTAVLFVWVLDDDARRAAMELDTRVQRSKGTFHGVIVMMQTDRAAVRNFVAGLQVRVPILFGTQRVAQQYQVATGVDTLYLISERGVILRSQTGRIRPADILR